MRPWRWVVDVAILLVLLVLLALQLRHEPLKQRTLALEKRVHELELELADHTGQAREWRNDAAREHTRLQDQINLDRHYSRRP